jgi:hypothetical protein
MNTITFRRPVELDPIYNINLHSQHVDLRHADGMTEAIWRGRRARVLHFNGWGRHKYSAWHNTFGRASCATSLR